jgi:hypothetical protein
MFRYFRIIRKKLIEQDNVRKYLLYAIGEVLLVVIGILIALQINNWNEDKQAKIRMLTNIISIQDDIQVEIQILGNVIQTLHSQVESAGSIVPLMESRDRIVQDSLKFILDFNRLTNTPIITRRSNTWDFLNASGDISEFPDSELLSILQDYYRDLEQTTINFTNTAIPTRLELRKLKYELFTDTEHRKFFPTNTPIEPGSAVYDSIFNDPRVLPLCRYIGSTARFFENEFISIQKKSLDLSDYINNNYR